jgi:hypothetical protein
LGLSSQKVFGLSSLESVAKSWGLPAVSVEAVHPQMLKTLPAQKYTKLRSKFQSNFQVKNKSFSSEKSIEKKCVHQKKTSNFNFQSPLENFKKSIVHLKFFNRGCSGQSSDQLPRRSVWQPT